MRLVGYDRAPARLPRGSGAPAAEPARRSPIARATRWRRSGCPRSSAGASCRARWLRAARGATAARRGRGRQEPDLRRLRGDAHVAAARPARRRARATSRAASPTSACSRSGPVVWRARRRQGAARRADVRGGHPGRAARRLAQAGRAARLLRRQAGRRASCCAALGVVRADASSPRGATAACLHPGARRAIRVDGTASAPVGQVGEVHPAARARARARRARASTSRSLLDALAGERRAVRSVPPPRFPAVTRDVSFWIDAARHRRRAARRCWRRRPSRCCASCAVLEDYRDPKLRARRARRGCSGRSPTAPTIAR